MGGLGSKDLARYHETRKPLAKTSAIRAKCADCTGNYADGRLDCTVPDCLLNPYMPYTAENLAKTKPDSGGGDNIAHPSPGYTRKPSIIGYLGEDPAMFWRVGYEPEIGQTSSCSS